MGPVDQTCRYADDIDAVRISVMKAKGRARLRQNMIINTYNFEFRIQKIMGINRTAVDDITQQLKWYGHGHVQRMSNETLPKQVLDWKPAGSRKRGRSRKSWREGKEEDKGPGKRISGWKRLMATGQRKTSKIGESIHVKGVYFH